MKIKRENFSLKKFKKTQAGIMVQFSEKMVLSNNVETKCLTTKTFKDDPQAELVEALEAFEEIVMYDEDYKKGTEIKVTGVIVFPEIECGMITHLKPSVSGLGAKNSGRISKDSETFAKATKFFDMVDILADEVYEYVFNGKRAQLALFDVESEEVAPSESEKKMEVA